VAYAEYADATDLNAAIAPRRVADSRVMRELLATVKLIAPKNVNVLILGEPRQERSSSRR
jgi:transcriptional regulator with GAF, ATPase, and Fis domain